MTPLPVDEPVAQPVEAADNPETPPSKGKGVSIKQALKIVVSLALIAFLLHKTGLERTFSELSKADLWMIPVCIAAYLFAQFISTWRWQFLARALDFNLSMRELYDYYLIGMFSNQFLPGAIGGDAVRMFMLAKSANRKKREALLTLLAERGVGLIAIMMFTTAICLLPSVSSIDWGLRPSLPGLPHFYLDTRLFLVSLSLIGIVGYLVLWFVPLERWVERFPKLALLKQAKVYWSNIPLLIKSVGVSMLVQGMMIGIQMLILKALHVQIPVLDMAAVYGMVSLISVLPLTWGGLGVREAAYQTLLMKVGLPDHTALAFGVYWLLVSTLTSLIGGLVLIKGHYKTPTSQETDLSA